MKRHVLAEIVGTFIIVFVGTGAIIYNESSSGCITHLGVCVLWGMGVTLAILIAGSISESHYNPAVTLSFVLAGKLPFKKSIEHIAAQLVGAIMASFVLLLLFPQNATLGATLPTTTPWGAAAIELLISFLLMLTIALLDLAALKNKPLIASIVGAAVILLAYFAGPLTGASMNPARSIGPAIISGHTEYLLLYLTAPLAGMLLAAQIYRFQRTNSN